MIRGDADWSERKGSVEGSMASNPNSQANHRQTLYFISGQTELSKQHSGREKAIFNRKENIFMKKKRISPFSQSMQQEVHFI